MLSEIRRQLALLTLSVVLALVTAEVIVRFIEPREVLREFFETSDPILHHRLIPGARARQKTIEFDAPYQINALGLRQSAFSREKPTGIRRILVLGDSFTEGVGVRGEETFASQLQTLLDVSGYSTRWQVINAGVASYSPLLEYLYLSHAGLALAPDLVILNFDLSDVYDDIHYGELAELNVGGQVVAVHATPAEPARAWPFSWLTEIKDAFKYHTRVYNFVRRRLAAIDRATVDRSGDVRFDKYGMLREDLGPRDDHGWSQTYAHLRTIRDMLKAQHIDFWISVYPYGLQVSTREWDAGRQYWGFEAGRVYSDWPQQLMMDFGRKNDIPVVNMVPDFREASRTLYPLYYDFDGHWRAAGHRVAAAALHHALVPYLEARSTPD